MFDIDEALVRREGVAVRDGIVVNQFSRASVSRNIYFHSNRFVVLLLQYVANVIGGRELVPASLEGAGTGIAVATTGELHVVLYNLCCGLLCG